ncbi:MAG: recombination protein RecR, partial [Oscillospiraceae bacterium]|nr:recombination protein RecR [Oscillospiraceae bacterium]
MEYFPAALESLVEQFARLPGIGSKSAQRLAFYVLSLSEDEAQRFADAIVTAKRTVTFCPVCRNLTDGGLCPICSSPKRDPSVICVVADPRDVVAIERAREFSGRYHVLHGVISPMNHIGPDDLEIKSLLDRVAKGGVEEVIMATNPDTEGEATAMYLARLLRPFGVRVTRLAYGIPVGGH